MAEKAKALAHFSTIRDSIRAIEAHAESVEDETLRTLAAVHHHDLAIARQAYLKERGWLKEPAFVAFSGGEDKPPKVPEPDDEGTGG